MTVAQYTSDSDFIAGDLFAEAQRLERRRDPRQLRLPGMRLVVST